MSKQSLACGRRGGAAHALVRLLLAPVAWRKCMAEHRRERLGQHHIDRMSGHMLKDIGFSRWYGVRNEADRRHLR